MPAAKKSAAKKPAPKKTTTTKKAAPKKAAPKKSTAKPKAQPKPTPAPPPTPAFKPKSVYLLTNSGEFTLSFGDQTSFDAAIATIKQAPSKPSGSRSTPTYSVDCAGKKYQFQIVTKYIVTDI